MRVAVVLLVAFPLLFFWHAWATSNGLPVFKDTAETWHSYNHALALLRYPISRTWLVTIEWTDLGPLPPPPSGSYLHNPNGPRFLHLALLLLGIRDLALHVLILGTLLSTLGAAGCVLLGRRLSPGWPGFLLPVAFALDGLGTLIWLGNTYRAWSWPLLWGLLAAVAWSRPRYAAALAFALLQFEYGFALYALTAALALAILLHGRAGRPVLLALFLGAGVSVLLTAVQLLGYAGPQVVWQELLATVARRGPDAATDRAGPFFEVWQAIAGWYGRPYAWLVVLAILTAPLVLRRRPCPMTPRYGLAALMLSLAAGLTVPAVLMRGYVLDAYVSYQFPSWQALVVVATATAPLLLDYAALLGLKRTPPWLPVLLAACLMLPTIPRVFDAYPPQPSSYVPIIRERYADAVFVAPSGLQNLAFALQGGRQGASGGEPVVAYPLPDAYRRYGAPLFWLCTQAVGKTYCDEDAERMAASGYTIADRGPDFVIVRLAP